MADNPTTLRQLFTEIAESIRAKNGGTEKIIADDFPEAIDDLNGSGGTQTYPSYAGSYSVTPKVDSDVVLPTKYRVMRSDVTVSKIPITRVSNGSGGVTVIIGSGGSL